MSERCARLNFGSRDISSNDMAKRRTLMAAERTLLAWVRTAMSFISFGFTMYKLLNAAIQSLASKMPFWQGSNVGIFLVVVGTVPLAVGMYQYYKTSISMGRSSRDSLLNPSFTLAVVVLGLGIVLSLDVIFNWNLI